jgi:MATE family multidrug resistance protein
MTTQIAATTFASLQWPSLQWPSPRFAFRHPLAEARNMARAASPIILIGLLNMAISITDVVMVGRYDPGGLAAIIVVSDLYSIIFNFSVGFTAVVTPHVAAAVGAKAQWYVRTIVRRTGVAVIALAIVGAIIIVLAGDILSVLGVDMRQRDITVPYARYMAGAYIFMVLFAFGRNVLSAIARSRFAIGAIVLAVPFNVVANYVCMYGGFGWSGIGVAGAGLASLIVAAAAGGSTMLFIFISRSFSSYCAPAFTAPTFDLRELLKLVKIGSLMGFGAVAETGIFLSSTILVSAINADALTAHALAFRTMAVCYVMVSGLGQAVTIRTAYLSGRNTWRLERYTRQAVVGLTVLVIVLLMAILVLASQPLAVLLSKVVGHQSTELTRNVAVLLQMSGLALAAAVPAHMACSLLRAKGNVLVPGMLLACGYWGVGLSGMLVLGGRDIGAEGVWLALVIGAASASIACVAYLHCSLVRECADRSGNT